MDAIRERLREIEAAAWVRFVQWLNWIAGGVFTVVLAINAAYPQFVLQLGSDLPTPVRFAAVITFASLVQYALHRANKAA